MRVPRQMADGHMLKVCQLLLFAMRRVKGARKTQQQRHHFFATVGGHP
jgi:hypothetical protein